MPKPDRRPFTLADLMILIAAIAAGFPLARWIQAEPRMDPATTGITSYSVGNWLNDVWLMEPSCFAVLLTLVLIPLRWRRPRPRSARVIRQPGAVACLAAAGAMVAALAVDQLHITARAAFYKPGVWTHTFTNLYYWGTAARSIPLAVLGAWTALAVCGRWSPERSWIDRLGRALGVFWVLGYPVHFFRGLLNYWLPYAD